MVMIFNIAPATVLAEIVVSSVSINDYTAPIKSTQDLGEEVDVSSSISDDDTSLHLNFEEKDDAFPADTNAVKMFYTLDEGVIPAQSSGSNNDVRWEYDEKENQLVFTWVGEKKDSFSADIALIPARPARRSASRYTIF